jgi:uncharacterized protein (TIGR02217 family)
MNFHEVRFPANLSFGSMGGPERRTEIVTLANGFEERNTPWAHSRRRYDAGLGLRSLDDIEALVAFFEARRGQMYGFRWKDWSDFKSCPASRLPAFTDQVIGIGDGTTAVWQLSKTYASGIGAYQRPVKKPVEGTVRLGVQREALQEQEHWTMDAATGLVTFVTPPAAGVEITAGFEFDVPVRFDIDRLDIELSSFDAADAPVIPLVEVFE